MAIKIYNPPASRIKKLCQQIQDEWSPETERYRRGVSSKAAYTVPGATDGGVRTELKNMNLGVGP